MHETFFSLLRDSAHWEFEIFLQIVVDGIILGILYPFIARHVRHHLARDKREELDASPFKTLSSVGLKRNKENKALAENEPEKPAKTA